MRYARDGWAVDSGQYEKNTGRLPDWYLKKPVPIRGDDFYLRAFWELSSCRNFGFVVGPIPWNAIIQYGQFVQLDSRMLEFFVQLIRSLDEEYLKYTKDQQHRRTTK